MCGASLLRTGGRRLDCLDHGKERAGKSPAQMKRALLSTLQSARRSDFDVTDTVQVSSPAAVRAAIEVLFAPTWPVASLAPLDHAFDHFERLFDGRVPGYFGVDTLYHDRQHTLA